MKKHRHHEHLIDEYLLGKLKPEDQDEFEVDKDGKPIKPANLQRGEFEVDKSKPLETRLRRPAPASAPKRRGADEEFEVK